MKVIDRYHASFYPLLQRYGLKFKRRRRILLFDNGQDMLDMMEAALTDENYRVKGTRILAEFQHQVARWHPDLIILDLKLPEGDGGKICQALKADKRTTHIPVILCSAYIVRDADWSAFSCDAVIPKPFDLSELIEMVSGLVQI